MLTAVHDRLVFSSDMNQNGWFFVHRSPIVCPSPSETTPTTHNNEPKDNEEDTLNDWEREELDLFVNKVIDDGTSQSSQSNCSTIQKTNDFGFEQKSGLRPRKLAFTDSLSNSESQDSFFNSSLQSQWQHQTYSQPLSQPSSFSTSNSPLLKTEYKKPLRLDSNAQFCQNSYNTLISSVTFNSGFSSQQYGTTTSIHSLHTSPVHHLNGRSVSAPNSPMRPTPTVTASPTSSMNVLPLCETTQWNQSKMYWCSPPPSPSCLQSHPSSGHQVSFSGTGHLSTSYYSSPSSLFNNFTINHTTSYPSNNSLPTRDERAYHRPDIQSRSKMSPNRHYRRYQTLPHHYHHHSNNQSSFHTHHYDQNSRSYLSVKTNPLDTHNQHSRYSRPSHNSPQTASPTNSFKAMTKQMLSDFVVQLKAKEHEGNEAQLHVIRHYLTLLPPTLHWRVYLDVADLSKRESHFRRARCFYERAIVLQPREPKAWLEYAKMEEEHGHLSRAERILRDALFFCPFEENLIIKCMKIQEKLGNVHNVRRLLGTYRHRVELNNFWKTIVEGALFESRLGNVEVARTILYILSRHVPWSGVIYVEGIKLEMRLERCSDFDEPNNIQSLSSQSVASNSSLSFTPLKDWSCCDPYVRERIQQRQQYQLFWIFSGLRQAPNYSPLYFSALSVLAQEHSPALHTLISPLIRYAAQHLSKELMWKLYLEFAAIEERHQRLSQARLALTHSVLLCPSNLRWRVWIQGARTELSAGNIQNARRLLTRALHVVPDKVKYIVYLEIAHLEEYLGCVDRARDVLNKAKKEMQSEWKIFLESVLLEIRAQNYSRALEEVKEALQVHFQTGRLHAIHIYIVSHFKSFLPSTLNLQTNEWQILKCAIYEVPKAGEVWTEAARLALKTNDFVNARRFLDFALEFTPQYGDSFVEYLRLELLQNGPHADLTRIEQLVMTSTPNYGVLWNFCKTHQQETPIQILANGRRWLLLLRVLDPKMDLCFYLNSRNVQTFSNEEKKRLIFGWL